LFIHYTEQNCDSICRHLGWYRPSDTATWNWQPMFRAS